MLPTVAQILALDPVRAGRPRVVAGARRLDAPVRWVHAIELADAARLLRGGELVLTTGIALPEAPARAGGVCRRPRRSRSERAWRSSWAAGIPVACRPASSRPRRTTGCR